MSCITLLNFGFGSIGLCRLPVEKLLRSGYRKSYLLVFSGISVRRNLDFPIAIDETGSLVVNVNQMFDCNPDFTSI